MLCYRKLYYVTTYTVYIYVPPQEPHDRQLHDVHTGRSAGGRRAARGRPRGLCRRIRLGRECWDFGLAGEWMKGRMEGRQDGCVDERMEGPVDGMDGMVDDRLTER